MSRFIRIAGPALVPLVAIVSMFGALFYGDGAAAPLLADPGEVVRLGLPTAKLLVNFGAAGTIGALVLACFALSSRYDEFGAALDFAAAAAAVLTFASALTGLFTFLNISNVPLSFGQGFGDKLGLFLTQFEAGQAWLITTLIAAVVTVLCFAVRNQTALAFVTVFAAASLLPMAQQGHAAGTVGHDAAITSLGLHLVFAAIWLGGLLTIMIVRRSLTPDRLTLVLSRYSTLALVSFIVIAASGYVSAELRIGTWPNVLSSYGVLVMIKIAVLVMLGICGFFQRRYFVRRIGQRHIEPRSAFWWLIAVELAFMGIAFGVAAALARTTTPVAQTLGQTPTAAEILTGEPLPPELTIERYLTEWRFDLVWLLICGFGIVFYLAGVRRMRKRGDAWPLRRTVLWVLGMIVLFFVTNGAVNVYQKYLFSAHMLAHMTLSMMVPIFLVSGAPVTLALRTSTKRKDGSRGGHEWILCAINSRFARIVSNPIVAAVLFVGSLWIFYYSPIFAWATKDHLGHQWMIVHFLIVGYLFVQSLIGVDPVPFRLPYPFRLLLLLGTMAFHAFFGLALMSGSALLLADWYGAMGRPWGPSAIMDQQTGGGIAWSVGEIPTVILAVVVVIMWSRSDAKETRRLDRQEFRTGEAELNSYNAALARLEKKDR